MTNLIYRTTSPSCRINEHLFRLSDQQHKIINHHMDRFLGQTWVDPLLPQKNETVYNNHEADFLSASLIYLISETVGDYPYPYFTEKTWKAIVNQRPFMLVGAQGSLSCLRNMGFKTFSAWWDESYDTKPNIGDRIDCIVQQLEKLSRLSDSELLSLEQEILPTVIYNLNHLVVFKKKDLDNIANSI